MTHTYTSLEDRGELPFIPVNTLAHRLLDLANLHTCYFLLFSFIRHICLRKVKFLWFSFGTILIILDVKCEEGE